MSALARSRGWHGFDGIGERVKGGYRYDCDGMPTLRGCGAELVTKSRLARVGRKGSGWLVTYGLDFDGTDDPDVVLTFCPSCAKIVESQS